MYITAKNLSLKRQAHSNMARAHTHTVVLTTVAAVNENKLNSVQNHRTTVHNLTQVFSIYRYMLTDMQVKCTIRCTCKNCHQFACSTRV